MRFVKLSVVLAVLLLALPALADSWGVFSIPTAKYLASTTNFGGGDGSGGSTYQEGPFLFYSGSNFDPLTELSVPGSWATWNSPPFTESSTPNVLSTADPSASIIVAPFEFNTVGFELEPAHSGVEPIFVRWGSSTGDFFYLDLNVNGDGGALLFAVEDNTPGATILGADIIDGAGDSFAIAQLRAGLQPTPEPGTLALFGSGALALLGLIRRKHVLDGSQRRGRTLRL